MLTCKHSRYKLFWTGNNKDGKGGVSILLAESWVVNVFDVVRTSDEIILLKLVIGKDIYTIISVYAPAPQSGLPDARKDEFMTSPVR